MTCNSSLSCQRQQELLSICSSAVNERHHAYSNLRVTCMNATSHVLRMSCMAIISLCQVVAVLTFGSSLADEAGMLERQAELCISLCCTDLDVRKGKGKVKQQSERQAMLPAQSGILMAEDMRLSMYHMLKAVVLHYHYVDTCFSTTTGCICAPLL